MSANSRLTIAAHALAWIGLYQRQGHDVATSEQIATSANTNPVVIRRLLGELRAAGLVESRRGAGAGWSLASELESMTLLDVYKAVEPGPLFALHRAAPDQGCAVGYGIKPAMQGIYEHIEETLRHELARVTLEDVLRDVLAASREASAETVTGQSYSRISVPDLR
ncbi:Rrf2 family transcriptional regulator [Streptomyces sp. NBC_01198]|uniref:Rrf2 family transcriptional regulator n=1 Tax=Streptomyces sp. NBC_01198 TaxID=2903769 RepID=UPI002E11A8BC|nr:Rrf2 family transcriptional regulator [Streptomyces sp. NBC_01198]